MKNVAILIILLASLVSSGVTQIVKSEITVCWDERTETLIPENTPPPFETAVGFSSYLGRIRLQDARSFPILELRYLMNHRYTSIDTTDFRVAGIFRLPVKGLSFKGIYVEQNSDNDLPEKTLASYIIAKINNLNLAVGMDYKAASSADIKLYSARAKYQIDRITFLGGMSSNPDDIERFSIGSLIELPGQMMAGGLLGIWDDDKGYAINVGRFNKRNDFDRFPSFSINYLEVPQTYKWTSFRIMFGSGGAHYVRSTFDNSVFSGQLDLDVALMLSELIPNNYRHFDSPLLFLRYDEYGTMALRMNYIETETGFRKFDANINYMLPISSDLFQTNRATLSFERMHNPVFGWQDNRYHLNIATYLYGRIYSGLTISEDFSNYSSLVLEFRIKSEF